MKAKAGVAVAMPSVLLDKPGNCRAFCFQRAVAAVPVREKFRYV